MNSGNSKRLLLAQRDKQIRNWRIVAGVLLLVAVYGLVGRMDREAQAESMTTAQGKQDRYIAWHKEMLKGTGDNDER